MPGLDTSLCRLALAAITGQARRGKANLLDAMVSIAYQSRSGRSLIVLPWCATDLPLHLGQSLRIRHGL